MEGQQALYEDTGVLHEVHRLMGRRPRVGHVRGGKVSLDQAQEPDGILGFAEVFAPEEFEVPNQFLGHDVDCGTRRRGERHMPGQVSVRSDRLHVDGRALDAGVLLCFGHARHLVSPFGFRHAIRNRVITHGGTLGATRELESLESCAGDAMAKVKAPNESLKALLHESGWTYGSFAMAVNRIGTEVGRPTRYEESSVTHWLKGTMPRKEVRACVVEALSRRLFRPVTYAEAGFPPPEGGEASTGPVEGLVDLGRQDMDPSRRSVLGAALFSVALTIPDWQDVVGRIDAFATGKATRIGMGEVKVVQEMTTRVSELDDQFGGRHARPMAAAFAVNSVAGYLKAEAPDDVRKAMMSAAADLYYLTGYMAVDEGLHGLAQRYYLKALELAGAADDHLTYCTTLRGMSVQAVDLGHSAHSMRLADAASAASPQAGPRMRAFLAGQQAHAAAQLGKKDDALRHMREAEIAMDVAESRESTFGSYDPSTLMYHLGQVKYELGDNSGAVEALQESNKLRHSYYRRTQVRYLSLTAERQLSIGHLEAACDTWSEALDHYPLVQSGRCDEKMKQMANLLTPYSSNRQAHALLERARAVGVPVAV